MIHSRPVRNNVVMRLMRPFIACVPLAVCGFCCTGCPPEQPPEPMVVCSLLPELTGTWVSDDADVDLTMDLGADGGMEGNGSYVPCCSVRMVATWEVCGTMPGTQGTLHLLTSFLGHPCCATGVIDPPEPREALYQFIDPDTIMVTGLLYDANQSILFEREAAPRNALQ